MLRTKPHSFYIDKISSKIESYGGTMPVVEIYKKYFYDIYPRIKDWRGATHISKELRRKAADTTETLSEEISIEPITEKEWDNLIILDAARHDVYEQVKGRPIEKRITVGSASKDFVRNTFSKDEFQDTILVGGNAHYGSPIFRQLTGRKIEDVFYTEILTYQDNWSEVGTVLPEDVARDAETAEKLFPEKRKIIHFMQPHQPFINSNIESKRDPWKKAEQGNLSQERAWEAYRKNLEYVLEFVEQLNENIDGRTVVTADHGNLVGEKGLYGHPEKSKARILREVPWDVIG